MDVTVVGSCNTDLISYVPRLPKPGETIQGSKFSMGFGGKGANQCIMSGRLGAKTAMVAKVGKDSFGDTFIQNFKDNRINTEHVSSTSEAMTGAAPICVDDSGQNSIVIVPGANFLLGEDDLEAAESLIGASKVVVCQLEIQPAITLASLKMAKAHGVMTILNPAPALPSLDPEFYKLADIFCPNESEAELLTGIPVHSVEDAGRAAKALRVAGCNNVIITLGELGVVILPTDMDVVHVAAPKVDVIDTTGAGDAFIGSMAYYLSTQPSLGLTEVVTRAVQIASISVQKPGTQTSFPLRSELPEDLFS